MLSIAEIEKRYEIDGYYWIYKWAKEGRLHVVPVGKRFKYLDFEVRELLRLFYSTLGAAAA